jgi:hypothetical protein
MEGSQFGPHQIGPSQPDLIQPTAVTFRHVQKRINYEVFVFNCYFSIFWGVESQNYLPNLNRIHVYTAAVLLVQQIQSLTPENKH